jgi:signal transduction histidine kinase
VASANRLAGAGHSSDDAGVCVNDSIFGPPVSSFGRRRGAAGGISVANVRLRPLVAEHWFDLVVLLAAAEAAIEVTVRHDATAAPHLSHPLAAVLLAAVVGSLLVRRSAKFAAPAALWIGGAALSFVDGRLMVFTSGTFLAGLFASFLLGYLPSSRRAWLGLAVVFVSAVVVMANDPDRNAGDLIFIPTLFSIGWVAGWALRQRLSEATAAEERALRAEREREAVARVAVAEERARIARELHDVVAHAVSVMVLQIGAVRHKLPTELTDDKDALIGVERAGRTALTEMRRLLGAMREADEDVLLAPQPGLDHLPELVERVKHAGVPVTVSTEGVRTTLPRGVELSAYRIIQEALTNTLKHARASRADVNLVYASNELLIDVRDDGRGITATDGLGHGLIGMRERVKLYGGEMSAGPLPTGGFGLQARLRFDQDGQ